MLRLLRLSAAGMAAGALTSPPRADLFASSSPRLVVAVDGLASLSEQSSKDFLLSRPAGAYTTARTCCGTRRIFEWETHVQRTADSAAAMIQDASSQLSASPRFQAALVGEIGTASGLRPRLEATVAAALREYCSTYGEDHELKLTMLVSWPPSCEMSTDEREAKGTIACHVQPLPPLPEPPVRVEVRGSPRANAAAKDSTWVSERAPLEALRRSDINEMLLVNDDGELLEGSQTNVSQPPPPMRQGSLSAHAVAIADTQRWRHSVLCDSRRGCLYSWGGRACRHRAKTAPGRVRTRRHSIGALSAQARGLFPHRLKRVSFTNIAKSSCRWPTPGMAR